MSDLKTSFTIDRKIVQKTNQNMKGLDIYIDDRGEEITLFFVNSKKQVEWKMFVSADCGQDRGYIADWSFEKVN